MWNLNFLIALLLIFLCSKVNKPKRSSWKFKNTELRAFMEPLCNKVIWKKSTKTTKESFWTWTILVLTLSVHSYMIPVKEQRIPYFLKRSSHESSASVSTDFLSSWKLRERRKFMQTSRETKEDLHFTP